MDGSAEAFAEMIESAGIVEQSTARRALLVRETVGVEAGNRRISIEPADAFEIDCVIDFPHPLIGVQHRSITLNNGSFARDIASARTFGFVEEVEALRRAGAGLFTQRLESLRLFIVLVDGVTDTTDELNLRIARAGATRRRRR